MKAPIVKPDGSVHCPKCGSTSFTPQRTTGTKLAFGFLSLLAAPKLKCNGCGIYLDPKHGTKPKSLATTPRPMTAPMSDSDRSAAEQRDGIGPTKAVRRAKGPRCEKHDHLCRRGTTVCPIDGSQVR
jgi:hypothetical protein